MAHFQHNRKAKDLSDTGHGKELRKLLSHFELFGNHCFDPIDLFLKMLNDALRLT